MAIPKVLKSVKDTFIAVCRRFNGRVEDSTCFIPLRNLYYALDELGKEVAREGAYGVSMLRFVGEEVEPRRERRVLVQLIPRGRSVEAFVQLSSHTYDRLYKTFRKEAGKAEGEYTIRLENEFTLRAQDRVETTWEELGDTVNRLVSDLSIETTKVAGVDGESWRWFKRKVEESHDWWELARR